MVSKRDSPTSLLLSFIFADLFSTYSVIDILKKLEDIFIQIGNADARNVIREEIKKAAINDSDEISDSGISNNPNDRQVSSSYTSDTSTNDDTDDVQLVQGQPPLTGGKVRQKKAKSDRNQTRKIQSRARHQLKYHRRQAKQSDPEMMIQMPPAKELSQMVAVSDDTMGDRVQFQPQTSEGKASMIKRDQESQSSRKMNPPPEMSMQSEDDFQSNRGATDPQPFHKTPSPRNEEEEILETLDFSHQPNILKQFHTTHPDTDEIESQSQQSKRIQLQDRKTKSSVIQIHPTSQQHTPSYSDITKGTGKSTFKYQDTTTESPLSTAEVQKQGKKIPPAPTPKPRRRKQTSQTDINQATNTDIEIQSASHKDTPFVQTTEKVFPPTWDQRGPLEISTVFVGDTQDAKDGNTIDSQPIDKADIESKTDQNISHFRVYIQPAKTLTERDDTSKSVESDGKLHHKLQDETLRSQIETEILPTQDLSNQSKCQNSLYITTSDTVGSKSTSEQCKYGSLPSETESNEIQTHPTRQQHDTSAHSDVTKGTGKRTFKYQDTTKESRLTTSKVQKQVKKPELKPKPRLRKQSSQELTLTLPKGTECSSLQGYADRQKLSPLPRMRRRQRSMPGPKEYEDKDNQTESGFVSKTELNIQPTQAEPLEQQRQSDTIKCDTEGRLLTLSDKSQENLDMNEQDLNQISKQTTNFLIQYKLNEHTGSAGDTNTQLPLMKNTEQLSQSSTWSDSTQQRIDEIHTEKTSSECTTQDEVLSSENLASQSSQLLDQTDITQVTNTNIGTEPTSHKKTPQTRSEDPLSRSTAEQNNVKSKESSQYSDKKHDVSNKSSQTSESVEHEQEVTA
ncbi:uncharacterized protein [Ptychodera flava]|uniref:uncharacterized protein n=1 Tax=Ptychodera flava TaxID=63121 RepID=UPI00396A84AA